MRPLRPILLLCILAIPACQSELNRAPAFPTKWSCTPLSELKGPIDVSLPPFAHVQNVNLAAGDRGRVGIVWRREVDRDSLQWDPTIQRFRVKGSDLTLPQSVYATSMPRVPPVLNDMKMPPVDREVFKQDEFAAMAVIGSQAVEGCQFFTGYPPDCTWVNPMKDVYFANGRWHAVFNLYATKSTPEPGSGIALAEFDASGWSKPAVIVPKAGAHPIWSFSDGSRIDLFWAERYMPFLAFPDSGMERQRVKHARIEPGGKTRIETVYECPKMRLLGFGSDDRTLRTVRLDAERYDLLLERHNTGLSWLIESKSGLMYVGDVLSTWPASAGPLAHYYDFNDCLALVLPGRRLQIVWDEEPECDCSQPGPRSYRIMEVHYDGRFWSSPREVTRPSHFGRFSLAGTAVQVGDRSAVLVVWQGEGKHLVYTVGSGSGQWSAPVTTSLVVGRRIWLAGNGDTVTLVTEIDRNLHWCRLSIAPMQSSTRSE